MRPTRDALEDCVGFGASLLVHVTLLLCLAAAFVKEDLQQVAITIISSTMEGPVPEQLVSIVDISEFSETDTILAPDESSQPEPLSLDDPVLQPKVTADDLVLSPPLADDAPVGGALAMHMHDVVFTASGEGAATQGLANVGGAIDRLTAEIVRSAAEKETLVVWLFDASLSLSAQREQIADRLAKILHEIDAADDLLPINHVVASFGERLNVIIEEPVDDRHRIVEAIRRIGIDESGVENIFASVERLSHDYAGSTRKRTMIIAFTDEVGDDQHKCDQTLNSAMRNRVAVYVVGTPAPFGIATTQLKFVDPDKRFDQRERWVEIDQGPESMFKMTLNISSLAIDDEPMESGFGPYALSRLCAFTGGVYFALHPNRHVGARVEARQIQPMTSRIQHFFDGTLMKKYQPDYRSACQQQADKSSNIAKLALVNACSQEVVDVRRDLKTVFEAPNQGIFVDELIEGQKAAAFLLTKVDMLYAILRQGETAARGLKEPRWKASFFLAMGRVLAIKTRLDAYNAVLGDAKMGRTPKNKGTNMWILEPSDDLALLNGMVAKQAESARAYLGAVVREFPGTPWAMMAQRELETPLSYVWMESRREPRVVSTTVASAAGAGPKRAPQDDQTRELPARKPLRKVDKI